MSLLNKIKGGFTSSTPAEAVPEVTTKVTKTTEPEVEKEHKISKKHYKWLCSQNPQFRDQVVKLNMEEASKKKHEEEANGNGHQANGDAAANGKARKQQKITEARTALYVQAMEQILTPDQKAEFKQHCLEEDAKARQLTQAEYQEKLETYSAYRRDGLVFCTDVPTDSDIPGFFAVVKKHNTKEITIQKLVSLTEPDTGNILGYTNRRVGEELGGLIVMKKRQALKFLQPANDCPVYWQKVV